MKSIVDQRINEHLKALNDSASLNQTIIEVAKLISTKFREGSKLLICGNGGSASDAQHLAAELMGKFETLRQPLPAIALTTDTSMITAWSNDDSFNNIFARQVEGLGKKGDILIAFSTSGNSPNIIHAINTAKDKRITTISFIGKDGGKIKGLCDYELLVKHDTTCHIQEVHEIYYHILCALIDHEVSK